MIAITVERNLLLTDVLPISLDIPLRNSSDNYLVPALLVVVLKISTSWQHFQIFLI